MKRNFVNASIIAACALVLLGTAGCQKKTVATAPSTPTVTPPPPPPPAEKPVIASFVAEPSAVVKGSPSTLRWSISGASDISIDQGIGSVQGSGTRQVFPSNDTTYTLVARGVGGTTSATVSVRVTAPESAPVATPTVSSRRSASEFLSQEVQDAFFDYDSFSVRDDARGVLTNDAAALKRFFSDDNYTGTAIVIEGHCDERGSDAYNVALGDKRAQAALEFLKGMGVAEARLKTVSYGKERQSCTDATEGCWQQNRRVHFAAQ